MKISQGFALFTVLSVLLFEVPSSAVPADEANKKILRDAVQGAITGAVTTEATNDEPKPAAVESTDQKDKKDKKPLSDGRRPPGWDKGRKEGWDGKDVPPGWDKGKKKGWGGEDMPPGLKKGKKK